MWTDLSTYAREHPYKFAGFAFLAVAYITGLVFLILYASGTWPDTSSKSAAVKIEGDLNTTSRIGGAYARLPDDARAPSEDEQKNFGLPGEGSYILTSQPFGRWTFEHNAETPNQQIFSDKFHPALDGGKYGYYVDGSGKEVKLTNVSGAYYNLYLTLAPDMFTNGFQSEFGSEDVTAASAQTLVDTMVSVYTAQAPSTFLLLQGTAESLPCSGGARPSATLFQFNVDVPVASTMNPGIDFSQIESQQLAVGNGSLRACIAYVDYTVELDANNSTTIRVYVSDCEGKMGDKCILIDGTVNWYDFVADELVTVRNENCLSFWNGQQAEAAILGTEAEDRTDFFKDPMLTAFADHTVGMPVELATAFNTADLKEISPRQELKFALSNSPSVRFRDVLNIPGVTEENVVQTLIDNPKYQVIFYDMPNLSLTAELSIA